MTRTCLSPTSCSSWRCRGQRTWPKRRNYSGTRGTFVSSRPRGCACSASVYSPSEAFRDYLTLATALANGAAEAEWRSASSRAYYSAFHVARDLMRDLGFRVPRAEQAHGYLWLRLSNAGPRGVERTGSDVRDLRQQRNRADYDDHITVTQATAADNVRL